ncbi:MAG: hypothetical protein RLZZ524_3164, partial [Pseudomonadota bacterium]
MSSGVVLIWPKQDVDALFRSMQLAQQYLNYDAGHALRAAAKHLLSSLGTSTRQAPKFREIVPSSSLDAEALGRFQRGSLAKRKMTAFDVTGWFGLPRRQMTKTVFSRDIATAKRRHATIARRGLAKSTWGAAARGMSGVSAIVTNAASSTKQIAAKYADSSSQLTGADLFIEINNYLPYIQSAIEGAANSVDTAMARAAA